MIDHHIDLIGGFCDLSRTSRPAIDEDVCVMPLRVTKLPPFVTYDVIDVDTDVSTVVDFCKCDKGIHKAPSDVVRW